MVIRISTSHSAWRQTNEGTQSIQAAASFPPLGQATLLPASGMTWLARAAHALTGQMPSVQPCRLPGISELSE